jgi:curli biogenesis system outer membrane secretion channel CsgG
MKIQRLIKILVWVAVIRLASVLPVALAQAAVSDVPLGHKKTVFVDVAGATEATYGSVQPVGTTDEGFNAMLVDALIRTGRFIVVERVALGDLQLEQDLGKSGATTSETAALSGRMLGASAVIRATVTKFHAAAGGSGIQIGIPLGRLFGGAAGFAGQSAVVEFNLRIIDTSTGQVVSTFKASGEANSTSANVAAVNSRSGANITASTFKNSPLGSAAESAINTAVKRIALDMEKVPWSASVVEFDDGKVYVSAGAAQNMTAGTTLQVYRKGKVLTDPETGVVLGMLTTRIGAIQIQSVTDKVSTAKLTSGEPPARGDLVKLD